MSTIIKQEILTIIKKPKGQRFLKKYQILTRFTQHIIERHLLTKKGASSCVDLTGRTSL